MAVPEDDTAEEACLHPRADPATAGFQPTGDIAAALLSARLCMLELAKMFEYNNAEIEALSDKLLQKLYSTELSVQDLVCIMRGLSQRRFTRESGVFACTVRNLLAEWRYFPSYPERELNLTAEFLGQLLRCDVLPPGPLYDALRCVVAALRSPAGSKMFRFGCRALEQFESRLQCFPELLEELVRPLPVGGGAREAPQSLWPPAGAPVASAGGRAAPSGGSRCALETVAAGWAAAPWLHGQLIIRPTSRLGAAGAWHACLDGGLLLPSGPWPGRDALVDERPAARSGRPSVEARAPAPRCPARAGQRPASVERAAGAAGTAAVAAPRPRAVLAAAVLAAAPRPRPEQCWPRRPAAAELRPPPRRGWGQEHAPPSDGSGAPALWAAAEPAAALAAGGPRLRGPRARLGQPEPSFCRAVWASLIFRLAQEDVQEAPAAKTPCTRCEEDREEYDRFLAVIK